MKKKETLFEENFTLDLREKTLSTRGPAIMGILNVTPDSFYDGGKQKNIDTILENAALMLEQGAHILDIGGYSTRPGAMDISVEEELNRVIPAIKTIKEKFPQTVISIDTFRSEVAAKAIDEGAEIVNDISGGLADEKMYALVAQKNVYYVLMHMKGTPQTMQQLASYDHLIEEVYCYFETGIKKLYDLGHKKIILDPGFGFAKTTEHNYSLLQNLGVFKRLSLPLLIGVSRKSMIYKVLNCTPNEALNGTTILNTFAVLNGASILRVHDVKEAAEISKLTTYLCR